MTLSRHSGCHFQPAIYTQKNASPRCAASSSHFAAAPNSQGNASERARAHQWNTQSMKQEIGKNIIITLSCLHQTQSCFILFHMSHYVVCEWYNQLSSDVLRFAKNIITLVINVPTNYITVDSSIGTLN
jgi:hypothetical protein